MDHLTTFKQSHSKRKILKPSSAHVNIDFLRARALALTGLETASILKQNEARTWPNSFMAIPLRLATLEGISRAASQLTLSVLSCGGSFPSSIYMSSGGLISLLCTLEVDDLVLCMLVQSLRGFKFTFK